MNSKMISRWFLLLLLLTCSVACSDDEEDSGNPFVGRWEIVSIEDENTATDYTGNIKIICFYPEGRISYTYTYYSDGDENRSEMSDSIFDLSYSYTDKELLVYHDYEKRTDTFSYSFSNHNKTLRVSCIKIGHGTILYFIPITDPLNGKTLVLKKI